ncbi:TPA: hypothetical protein JLN01_004018 [Escherichia coli]|nr:hypothetical protein [Escherichia coli]
MMTINYQVLREVAAAARGNTTWQNLQAFHAAATPEVVLELLEVQELLDVLDASLDAKPVASCIVEDGGMCVDGFSEYVGHSLPDGMHELYAVPPMRLPDGLEAAVAWKVVFTQVDQESNTFTAIYFDKAEVTHWVRLHKACDFRADITPLYAAPPVPDKLPREYIRGWPLAHSDYAEGWNDCREAMLKGGAYCVGR